jgi:xylulose-5-phosphate/fructose-6-phosphate phosphoketolase
MARFTIAMDAIDRVSALRASGAHAKEKLRVMQLECQAYAYENGIDKPEMDGWTWPGNR